MSKVWKFLRADEWIYSKVPMMLGCMLFFQLQSPRNGSNFLFVSYFLYVSMFLAFSYVINDFSDIEADKRAGKVKYIAHIPKPTVILLMLLIAAIGCIPMLLVVKNKTGFIISTTITYISGIMYSMPPFRFKERGGAGVIECALAQRSLPLLPIFFECSANYLMYALFVLISLLDGIRYLLIHQVRDMENDRKSGVHTFLVDRNSNGRILLLVCFLFEIILSIFILWKLFMLYRVIIIWLLLYLLAEKIGYTVMQYTNREWLCNYDFVPLELLFHIFIPCVCAAFIMMPSTKLFVCMILVLVTSVYSLYKHIWVFSIFVKSRTVPFITELMQDGIMCFIITLSIMLLQRSEFSALGFLSDFVISYVINISIGMLIPIMPFLEKVKIKNKIASYILHISVITIFNVTLILLMMLIVKIGIEKQLISAFISLYFPLLVIAVPSANLFFLFSSSAAKRAEKRISKNKSLRW